MNKLPVSQLQKREPAKVIMVNGRPVKIWGCMDRRAASILNQAVLMSLTDEQFQAAALSLKRQAVSA